MEVTKPYDGAGNKAHDNETADIALLIKFEGDEIKVRWAVDKDLTAVQVISDLRAAVDQVTEKFHKKCATRLSLLAEGTSAYAEAQEGLSAMKFNELHFEEGKDDN